MNMHVPQTLEAQVEARELVSVEKNILTPQSHKPVMGIVQDALLGAFLMTDPKVRISREKMMQLCMVGNCNLPEMPKGATGRTRVSKQSRCCSQMIVRGPNIFGAVK